MIYLLTNRRIVRDLATGRESISPDGRERPLPVFRLGTVSTTATGSSYELLPDEFVENYKGLTPATDADAEAGTRRMFLDLYQQMAAAPADKGDVLVFIHGFNYTLDDEFAHIRQLETLYLKHVDSPVSHLLYVSWPTVGKITYYPDDQEDALDTGRVLGRVLRKVVRFFREFFAASLQTGGPRPAFCGRKIHLAAHSMGNQVLERAILELNQDALAAAPLFAEALLLNADCDWTTLEAGQPLNRLPDYAERTHVYNHHSDDALLISETTKNHARRLGRHGPRDLDLIPPRTLVVDCTGLKALPTNLPAGHPAKRALPALARQAAPEGPPIKERLIDHWGYLTRPEVINDVRAVLRGEPAGAIKGSRTGTGSNRLYKL